MGRVHSSNDMAKGDAQLCEGVMGVTQAYCLPRSEHQPFDVNRYVTQHSAMERSAYQPFDMGKNAHQSCDMARDVANQFEITHNSAPHFDMTRHLSAHQHLEAPFHAQRSAQFEMARSGVQHHYDITRGVAQPFEPLRSGNIPYDIPRGPVGYEMERGSHQYEMPRMQPYEVRPTHSQQSLLQHNSDQGFQECPRPRDSGSVKEDIPQSLPDAQQSMEMPLEMPKTAPQPSVRTKPGHKTSGHPFDFAKGYAQQLEMAKKAAQDAIQAKIRAEEEERARLEAGIEEETKPEAEAEKSKSNAQPSEILKLYAQQLQMMKNAMKPSEIAKTPARLQEGARTGGLKEDKKSKMQYSDRELLGIRKASLLSFEDVRKEKHCDNNAVAGVEGNPGPMDKNKEDPPPFEMAKYLAQLSKTECSRNDSQEGQDSNMAENTNDPLTREENTSHSPSEAANPSGLPLSPEMMQNDRMPLGAGLKGGGELKLAKRDRQELTIANKAKLIEQVESRGAKKKADIAREWGVRPSTLSTIMKNKEKILTQFKSQRYAVGRRRMRTAAYPDVEEALLTWFRYARAAGIPITGPVLQGMGVTLAQELGHPEFSCSVGWLDRFKARHGLSFNPKNSLDVGMLGTFNEAQDRLPNPIVFASREAVMDTDVSSHSLFPPSMPAVAPDVTSGQIENSSPSWLSNAVSGLSNTVEETEEQLDEWFSENIGVEEFGHSETAEDLASTWLSDTVPSLLKERQARDIFSAGETALFYNLLPDKMLTVKGEDGHKWTWVKERVTVLVAVNMDGSEKLPLLIVGQKPSGQANGAVDAEKTLPLSFETNDSAMMTSALFESWLRQLDEQYQNSNRTISIIVENCPAHSRPKALSSVQLVFLPADTTSRLQPVERGVIHTLKSLYRQSVLEKMVDTLEAGHTYEVTLHQAMEMLQHSWKQVKTELIVKSFQKAGLQATQNNADGTGPDKENTLSLLERARRSGLDIPREVTFESYLKIDSEVQTTVEQEGEAELRVGSEGVVDPTSPDEALHALTVLKKFCLEQGGPDSFLDIAMDLEKWVAGHIVKTEVLITE